MSPAHSLAHLRRVAAPIRKVLSALVPAGALAIVAYLPLTKGSQLQAALVAVPPIVLFEVCGSAVLAAIGTTAVGMIPAWVPWAMLAGAISILVALRALSAASATATSPPGSASSPSPAPTIDWR